MDRVEDMRAAHAVPTQNFPALVVLLLVLLLVLVLVLLGGAV
jgi:hypothetical protein